MINPLHHPFPSPNHRRRDRRRTQSQPPQSYLTLTTVPLPNNRTSPEQPYLSRTTVPHPNNRTSPEQPYLTLTSFPNYLKQMLTLSQHGLNDGTVATIVVVVVHMLRACARACARACFLYVCMYYLFRCLTSITRRSLQVDGEILVISSSILKTVTTTLPSGIEIKSACKHQGSA